MGATIRARCQFADGLDVAAQLVGDHDPWFAEQGEQPLEEPLYGLCVSTCLHENLEHVAICADRAPQPMFLATDCNIDFVKMPLVVRLSSITADAVCELFPKAIAPQPDRLTADNHAPLCQLVIDIRRAQYKAMARPIRVSNDLVGLAEAFQAQHMDRRSGDRYRGSQVRRASR